MAIRFQCPNCQKTLNVPEQYAGRTSKCPGCSGKIKIPAGGSGGDDNPFGFTDPGGALVSSVQGKSVSYEASEDEGKSDPIEVVRLRSAFGWQSVAGGLNNIWLGTALQVLAVTTLSLVLGIVVTTGAKMIGSFGDGGGSSEGGAAIVAITFGGMACVAILVFIGMILRLIGCVRTLKVPSDSGAKIFAFLMLACELGVLGGVGVGFIGPMIHSALAVLGNLVEALAALAGLIALLLFIRQIGVALRAKPLPARVLNYAIWFGGGIVASVVVGGCGGVMIVIGGGAAFLGALLMIFGIMAIILTLFIKYLGTLAMASDEIKKRTGRSWV
jgi:hypothetical protein